MAGFFSVRVAPGLRVSASSRGLRAHVGPREARLHVGGGRTGVSTGAGPFTYYHSLGGGGRRRNRPRGRPAARPAAPSGTVVRPTGKAARARLLAEEVALIENLHRQRFDPAVPRSAPVPVLPDREELRADLEREHLRGTRFWQLSRRAAARRRAADEADGRLAELAAEAQAAHRAEQTHLDQQWQALVRNEPQAVLTEVAASFEDNAAPVGVDGAELSIVVLVPSLDAVPDRTPGVTAAGNPSIRKASATWRWDLYQQLVAGHALVSVREAFAVAPGIARATVVVLRDEGPDVYGRPRAEPVLATRIDRAALDGVRWQDVSAWEVVEQLGRDTLLETRGRADEVMPLDLADQPDLQALVESVDLEDLD